MPPMWWKLIKTLLLLFALFTTIVCINSEMWKRREAEAAAAAAAAAEAAAMPTSSDGKSGSGYIEATSNPQQQQPTQSDQQAEQQNPINPVESTTEDLNAKVRAIFRVSEGHGVVLFNTTTTDDASFMPIPAMLGDQPAPTDAQPYPLTGQEQHQQTTQQLQQKPNHYHQYQGLSQEPQSFKVQRSPDGKLNLVFNDPLISLQQTKTQPPGEAKIKTQTPRQPISDTFVYPDKTDQYTTPAPIDTGTHQCADNFKESRSFCTKVANYPDISGLKNILARSYANFFTNELTPTDLSLRMNDDEQPLCNSRTKYLYPELGQSVDKSWQVIVNTQEFKQAILIEECINEGESCQFLSAFPIGYVPVCKQHYVIRHLATVNNATSGQPEVANMPFKIPSCCKCVIKSKPGS